MVYQPQGFPTAAAVPSKPLEATVFVAASDARPEVKALADFVCTGSGDQNTIAQAINSLPSAGGKVKLSEGTFVFNGTLTILKRNITLEGSGHGTVIFLANGSNCDIIRVGDGSTALSNIKICNLTVDGNKDNQTAIYSGIYFYGGSGYLITNSVIENCYVKNVKYFGIQIKHSNYCIIRNNFLDSNGLYGILPYYSNYNLIEGNVCINNKSYGIRLIDSNYNVIYGNYVQGSSIGISSANNTVNNLYVGNCVVNCSDTGIMVYYQDVVVGNIVYGSGNNDIYLHSGVVVGNVCVSTAPTGIYILSSSSSGVVVGNYLSGQANKISVNGTDIYLGFNIEV
jgi:parallel beta-helix repeat protein